MINRFKQIAGKIYNSTFVRAAVGIFSTKIASLVIGLVTSVVTARGLGPAGKGLVATVNSIYGTGAQFANLGLHSANTYNIARDRQAIKPAFADSFWLCVVTGGICAAVFCVSLPQGGLMGLGPGLTAIALLMVPLSLMLMFAENLLLAAKDVTGFNEAVFAKSLLQMLLVAAAFAAGALVPQIASLCSLIVIAAVLAFCIFRIGKRVDGISFRFSATYLSGAAGYSFFAYLSNLFAYLLLRADVMIAKLYLADAAVGQYSLAVNMSDMIGMVNTSIASLLVPKLAAIQDPKIRKKTFFRIFKTTGFLMFGISAAVFLLAKPVVLLLYGRDYAPSVEPLKILAIANFFQFSFNFLFQYLAACGEARKTVFPVFVGMMTNFIFNFYFVRRFGIHGVALASLIAYFVVFVVTLPSIRKEMKKANSR